MNDLKTADIKINSLIRSSRKTLTLIVKPDASLVVRAPLFTSMRRIMDFVNKNQAWIKKRQDKIKSQPVIERLTPEVLEPKILRQYKKEAKDKITQRLDYYSSVTGLRYKTVKITSAKTRWGSCGPRGNLCFTWRLMNAPLEVIDYVVVHELVHTVQRDHSKKFWSKVHAIIPDYKTRRTWLRKTGRDLLL
jgi:predicted metal-dependent hydrolase